MDTAEGFIEVARSRVKNVEFRVGSADDLEIPGDSVDYVVSGLVLNFVPDPHAALAEMARIVRPGGSVVLYPILLTEVLNKKTWQKIGIRVVGSWAAASSLLVLALSVSARP